MPKKLKIREYPDPVLIKKTEKIKDPLDAIIQELILNMIETMDANNGVGLAAPQVGEALKLCIVDVDNTMYVLINPKITAKSKNKVTSEEGCLSFPGKFFPISRHEEVQVRFTDEKGLPQKIKAQGLLSRALQHEIDHLDGILIIKRMKKALAKSLEKEMSDKIIPKMITPKKLL